MKNIIKYMCLPLALIALLVSCKKFEELNKDPLAASAEQVQVEYFINNSLIGTQMDPHIAERVFVLYWEAAGHTIRGGGISSGGYNDGWSSDYYGSGYMSGWLNSINTAIQVADEKIANGSSKTYTGNLKQVARIWRAYLMSELADNFGPIPINAFQGINPDFADLKDVYYFMLAELKDAQAKLDVSITSPENVKRHDPVYGYDYLKWKKYANAMRLRLAMRLSEVDGGKAKSEFEAAAADPLLRETGETFKIKEKSGWDPLTGVMTREWNSHFISATINNLYLGLGGIKSVDQVSADKQPWVKPIDYIGLKMDQHFSTMTNDPSAGYWLDGLPYAIDPRAYKTYIIPGDFNNTNFNGYPSWDNTAETTTANLVDDAGGVVKTMDAKYHWNAFSNGDWGKKGTKNGLKDFNGTVPRMSNKFRASNSERIFFAPWETYFLLAEAAARGWTVPMTGKAAYEAGIDASFAYWDVSAFAAAYKTSQSYNRAGTSVSWDHTTEPPASYTMNFVNGYTNAPGTATIIYPKNDLYRNGTVKNDLITKIITQKFIAQTPWVPLENWNDKRRLGLPFFENPALENPLVNLPALNAGNFMTSDVKFFPQRLRYPSSLPASNAKGYQQAVGFLGGADGTLTPLWWAKH